MSEETALPKDVLGNNTPVRHPDDFGLIAILFRRRMPISLSCPPGTDPNRRDYIFTVSRDVSLAWIQEQDVPCVLAKKGGCCGKKKIGIMVYATENNVARWNGETYT